MIGMLAPLLVAAPGLLSWSPNVISDVAERITPAVVSLTTRTPDGAGPPGKGTGSGVIIDSHGLIVTSQHVVADSEDIRVTLADGRQFKGQVVGGDPQTDVAIVRIDANGLPTVPLGDARALRLGELVLAVGNPFGVGQTVTLGIVSATGRSSVGILDYEDFVQTDAAINPGNSGGALVNLEGKLVGINTSILSRTGGAQGVGFAIPSHVVVWVRDQLLEDGQVRHGWLGVHVQPLEAEVAAQLGAGVWSGVLVSDVLGAPARKAGLRPADVITHVDGERIQNPGQLRSRVGLSNPGRRLALTVLRGDAEVELTAVLGERGWVGPSAPPVPSPDVGAGVVLRPLQSRDRRVLGWSGTAPAWVVEKLEPGGVGDRSGLATSDIVVRIDGRPLESSEALDRALEEHGHVVLEIGRRGTRMYLVLH